nr:glycosyltransferase family 2 protein [uncultured Carboxylicivirga sp.]
MISIIIPNYNRSQFLAESLRSVINQSYLNWEVIVVDDCSTDDSHKVVQAFQAKDKRIQWVKRIRLPKGASTCRNIGVEHVKGEYLIFLDSDDLLAPHCLEQRLELMRQNPHLDMAVFPMQLFKQIPGDQARVWNIENNKSHLERFLNLDSVWQTTGPIWKKEAFLKTGGFNESLACWQDVDIHLKALLQKLNIQTFYQLPVDCYYRSHQSESISQGNLNTSEKLESRRQLYIWCIEQLEGQRYLAKSMAINIIASAIKTLRIKYALKFLKESLQDYKLSELLILFMFAIVYISRLYKIKSLNSFFSLKLAQTQAPIHVGKYYQ